MIHFSGFSFLPDFRTFYNQCRQMFVRLITRVAMDSNVISDDRYPWHATDNFSNLALEDVLGHFQVKWQTQKPECPKRSWMWFRSYFTIELHIPVAMSSIQMWEDFEVFGSISSTVRTGCLLLWRFCLDLWDLSILAVGHWVFLCRRVNSPSRWASLLWLL